MEAKVDFSDQRSVAMTRRQFLINSGRLALGAGLSVGLLSIPGCGNSSSSVGPWQNLAQRISGPVLLPGSSGYAALAQPNNLRYASTLPAGIARCIDADDVAQSILWSREFDVPLVARSGGHSYAGYSTTTGLMIDLSLMSQTSFDPSTGMLTIAGGIVNRELYKALMAANVTITHGRCPTVGGAAFLLGGGIGFNMRRYGLATDLVVATELVTANGKLVTASPKENPDLFWACQGGGGGNFGINTSFSLQTMEAEDLTVFNIAWTSNPEALYDALLAALAAAPAALGSRVQLSAVTPEQLASGQDVTITLLGQLVGTSADLADILQPAYRVAAPASADIRYLSYWTAQTFLSEPGLPDRYQEQSAFFVGPISPAAVATMFSWARRWPGTEEAANLVLFQTGDQVNAVAPDSTAFVHRNSDWLMTIALSWGADDSAGNIELNLDWQDAFYAAMRAYSIGSYVNFPDPALSSWAVDYYGANLPRLERIKAQVDPTQVFRFPQSIPPAVPTAAGTRSRAAIEYAEPAVFHRAAAVAG